jgi:hypothetical protein
MCNTGLAAAQGFLPLLPTQPRATFALTNSSNAARSVSMQQAGEVGPGRMQVCGQIGDRQCVAHVLPNQSTGMGRASCVHTIAIAHGPPPTHIYQSPRVSTSGGEIWYCLPAGDDAQGKIAAQARAKGVTVLL